MSAFPVRVQMTQTEAEALTFFIAERAELWNAQALSFGVDNPARIASALAEAHRKTTAEGLAS